MNIRSVLLGASVALVATAALATVTFDPNTGIGFVGKGDVQTVWGWNNAVAQAQANNVTFSYNSSDSYDVTIEFTTGPVHNITDHIVTQHKSTAVSATVSSDPRRTGQYTGWYLTGLGSVTTTGDAVPAVGDSCPNGDHDDCHVIAVTVVSSTGSGLYASDSALGLGPTQIY
jgi:hypothetical protein